MPHVQPYPFHPVPRSASDHPVHRGAHRPQGASVLASVALHDIEAETERRQTARAAAWQQANERLRRALARETARRKQAEAARLRLLERLITAREEERRRIARELHDQAGQSLTALKLWWQRFEGDRRDPALARRRLDPLRGLIARMTEEMHAFVHHLRPVEGDLDAALRSYAAEWSRLSGIPVDYYGQGGEALALPAPVATALYRIVQEALANALRHAGARRVSVVLQRHNGWALAIVEDDGQGFEVDAVLKAPAAGGRFGLIGMQERAGLAGGALTIESAPGIGTSVRVRVPAAPTEQTAP